MEVSVVSAKGVPANSYISMGVHSHRVMRPADSGKPCKFPESVAEPGTLKVEVLTLAGSARVVRQPGACKYRVAVPCVEGEDGEAMQLDLAICAAGDSGPLPAQEAAASGAGRKASQSIECQRYLDQHKLTEYLQAMVKSLLEAKPADPYVWMAEQLTSAKRTEESPAKEASSEKKSIATVRRSPKGPGGACVVVGPSGVGKSTLIKKLTAEFDGKFGFSVSHTTRDPRPGEQDGVDYHFVAKEQMEQDIKAGLFVEHAEVHGNYYGTSITAVESVMREGKVCLLDIDVQGADSVRKSSLGSKATFVFFAPPNFEVLEQRLRGRGTETEERVQKRLAGSKKEMAIYEANPDAWDLTLAWFNEDVEDAYAEFRSFLQGQLPQAAEASAVARPIQRHIALNTCMLGPSFCSLGIAPAPFFI